MISTAFVESRVNCIQIVSWSKYIYLFIYSKPLETIYNLLESLMVYGLDTN